MNDAFRRWAERIATLDGAPTAFLVPGTEDSSLLVLTLRVPEPYDKVAEIR
jgi:hypothetical protein